MSWAQYWNPFFMYVVDPATGNIITSRDYERASHALEAIGKAYSYYLERGQDVIIEFKNWENTLIMKFIPALKEYDFQLNNQQNGKKPEPTSRDINAPQLFP